MQRTCPIQVKPSQHLLDFPFWEARKYCKTASFGLLLHEKSLSKPSNMSKRRDSHPSEVWSLHDSASTGGYRPAKRMWDVLGLYRGKTKGFLRLWNNRVNHSSQDLWSPISSSDLGAKEVIAKSPRLPALRLAFSAPTVVLLRPHQARRDEPCSLNPAYWNSIATWPLC